VDATDFFIGVLQCTRTATVDDLSVGDGNLNLHAGLDGDGVDLLDDLRRRVEVDDVLVDPHLEAIPGLGTFTARSLPSGDSEGLGRHTDGPLDLQLLLLGAADASSLVGLVASLYTD